MLRIHCPMLELYVAAINGMAIREVVSWAIDKYMKASLCCVSNGVGSVKIFRVSILLE